MSEQKRHCPVCGASENLHWLWDVPNILQCQNCSLAYLNQMPSLTEIAAMYGEDFFKGDGAYADYVLEEGSLKRNFQQRLKVLSQFQADGVLFDAGCAHGFFLDLARAKYVVSGMDISESAIAYARKELHLDVHVGDFESIGLAPASLDVITMWDTIEHLYNPILAIEKSHEYLKHNGYLAITTGDLLALLPQLQKKTWRLLHLTHLYYFSHRSIRHLLENKGFELVHFSHIANWRSLRQIAQVITFGQTKKTWRNKVLDFVEKLPFLDIEIPLNVYDIMYIIARKR